MADKKEIAVAGAEIVADNDIEIRKLIHVVRGKQVMLDSDLAMLYHVETGNLNKAMKRNIKRFPDEFCFQLTKEEYENLKFQFGISSLNENEHGGRRSLPYTYTESGIAMLSSVLRSDIAIQVSIRIMKTFVEMRKYLAYNTFVLERINGLEQKQIATNLSLEAYRKQTDEKFEQVFDYIADHEESSQKVFFDGQIYDAFSLIASLVQKAEKSIILIDGYVDVDTLNLLAKKKPEVNVIIYTKRRTTLSATDINNFNAQYPTLRMEYTERFHDRFLILDEATAYHIGASIKDAGKKCFGITLMQDEALVREILLRLDLEAT